MMQTASNTTFYYQRPYTPPQLPMTPARYPYPLATAAHPFPAVMHLDRHLRCVSVTSSVTQSNGDGPWKISTASSRHPYPAESQKILLVTVEKDQEAPAEPHHQRDLVVPEATAQHASSKRHTLVEHDDSRNRNVEGVPVQPQQQLHCGTAIAESTWPKPATDISLNKTNAARRITVKSIIKGHRVWIDVAPNETGTSLAHKIYTIATFRTQRVIAIKTADGRSVTLDKSPVFATWAELQNFRDGEMWDVEWIQAERSSTMGALSRFLFSYSNNNS